MTKSSDQPMNIYNDTSCIQSPRDYKIEEVVEDAQVSLVNVQKIFSGLVVPRMQEYIQAVSGLLYEVRDKHNTTAAPALRSETERLDFYLCDESLKINTFYEQLLWANKSLLSVQQNLGYIPEKLAEPIYKARGKLEVAVIQHDRKTAEQAVTELELATYSMLNGLHRSLEIQPQIQSTMQQQIQPQVQLTMQQQVPPTPIRDDMFLRLAYVGLGVMVLGFCIYKLRNFPLIRYSLQTGNCIANGIRGGISFFAKSINPLRFCKKELPEQNSHRLA